MMLLLITAGFAQRSPVDSLRSAADRASTDTAKINALNRLAEYHSRQMQFPEGLKVTSEAKELADAADYTAGKATALEIEASIADSRSDFDGAINKYNEALPLARSIRDTKMEATIIQGIANAYYSKGINEKAMSNYMASLRLREKIADSSGIANSMMGLSIVYNDMNRDDLALDYALRALGIKERLGDKRTASWLLNNIGSSYLSLRDTVSALQHFNRSVAIKKELGDEYGLATTYNNIAAIHLGRKNTAEALNFYQQAYKLRMRLNPEDHHVHSINSSAIAQVFLATGKYDSAAFYTRLAIDEGKAANSYDALATPYKTMSELLARQGEFSEALNYLNLHLAARDSILNTQTNELMTEMASRYENEKKEQQLEHQQTEIAKQKQLKNMLLVIILLIILFAAVIFAVVYSGYRNKKRANALLSQKNAEIELQKAMVDEKNKDITDSIVYARRIQQAILPSHEYIRNLLPESFVLFLPKAIVSGDFYWIEKKGSKVFIAVVDCTGHGVPGAFMTFMAYSLLNEAVMERGLERPDAILNEMRSTLNRMLRQKNDAAALRDGMDISLCAIDLSSLSLEYAGAFNPLWVARKGSMMEISADKQPVGVYNEDGEQPFTHNYMKLEHGDMVYMFTDGYADQFGGRKGKKFKYRQLNELLLRCSALPAKDQQHLLESTLADWKGKLEQVDDICITGIRIS
jgi:serine phosphatase RsbU (regulator of sigma subunit)/tetratricopeptide (TPR) repeat protein